MQIRGIRTHIFVAGREIVRCPSCWIESIRHTPVTRAGVTLPDPDGSLIRALAAGDAVEIRLGYRDRAPASWAGSVRWVQQGRTRDQVEIGAAGGDLVLRTTTIKQAWIDERPETIVRWCVDRAGLTVAQIDAPGVTLPRFTAATIPVWQVVDQVAASCRRAFGIDMSGWALWLGGDGVHWGDHDEPGDVPVIASGEGLIRHTPATDAGGLNEVETWLVPGLSHSRLFRLVDSRRGTDATCRVLWVRHEVETHRARTFVRYGVEYDRL